MARDGPGRKDSQLGKLPVVQRYGDRGLGEDGGSRDGKRRHLEVAPSDSVPEWQEARGERKRRSLSFSEEANALLAGAFSWGAEASPRLPLPRHPDHSWLGDPISTTQVSTDSRADLQIQVPGTTGGLCPRLGSGRVGGHG